MAFEGKFCLMKDRRLIFAGGLRMKRLNIRCTFSILRTHCKREKQRRLLQELLLVERRYFWSEFFGLQKDESYVGGK